MDKSPPETTVRVVPLGLTLSSFLLVTYTLCIVFGLLAPETFHMHSAWAPLLPGFASRCPLRRHRRLQLWLVYRDPLCPALSPVQPITRLCDILGLITKSPDECKTHRGGRPEFHPQLNSFWCRALRVPYAPAFASAEPEAADLPVRLSGRIMTP